jgi:Fe-S-cluster-containing hydrogenase component 2
MSFLEDGIITIDDIQVPSKERLSRGPVAIIECVQEIPCNPCVDSCPVGAITMEKSINDLPEIDFEKCTGCALCVANCPGLAIFIIDQTYSEKKALVAMPYEFLPLPEKDEEVILLDRAGEPCGPGHVVRIRNAKAQDRTPVIFLAVDQELAMTVRFFRRQKHE